MTTDYSKLISVEPRGPSDGPAVVFLHPTPGDRTVWETVVAHRPAHFRTLLVDLPDHGAAPDDVSLDYFDFENATIALIKSVAARGPVTIAGVSFGAYLAARVLPTVGSAVSYAVLINGFDVLPQDVVRARLGLAEQIESGAVPISALREPIYEMALGKHRRREDEVLIDRCVLDIPKARILRALKRVAAAGRPEARVGLFATPATVVHATGDTGTPIALGEALAAQGANATWHPIDSDAHFLPITRPEEIAALVFRTADR